jgi:hypothetical protein
VCGKETVSDNAPGSPIKYLWTSASAATTKVYSNTSPYQVFNKFTVNAAGADTDASCIGMVFETYNDAACTTPISDPLFTHLGLRTNVWGNTITENTLEVDRSAPFLKKTKYIHFFTKGLESICKETTFEVCGAETVSLVNPAMKVYKIV